MALIRLCLWVGLLALCAGCHEHGQGSNPQASDVSPSEASVTSMDESDVTETDTAWDRWK